jgi:hypothetical protein
MNNIIRQAAWHFEAIQLIFKISMIFVCGAAQNKRFSIILASTVLIKFDGHTFVLEQHPIVSILANRITSLTLAAT